MQSITASNDECVRLWYLSRHQVVTKVLYTDTPLFPKDSMVLKPPFPPQRLVLLLSYPAQSNAETWSCEAFIYIIRQLFVAGADIGSEAGNAVDVCVHSRCSCSAARSSNS